MTNMHTQSCGMSTPNASSVLSQHFKILNVETNSSARKMNNMTSKEEPLANSQPEGGGEWIIHENL